MRTLLYIPAALLVAVIVACIVCVAAHWTGYVREMIVAALICAAGAELALLPAVLLRHSSHMRISQAGLAGTVIEMFLTLVLAAVVYLAALVPNRKPFVFWILAFYWMSLITLVFALTRLLRQAKADRT